MVLAMDTFTDGLWTLAVGKRRDYVGRSSSVESCFDRFLISRILSCAAFCVWVTIRWPTLLHLPSIVSSLVKDPRNRANHGMKPLKSWAQVNIFFSLTRIYHSDRKLIIIGWNASSWTEHSLDTLQLHQWTAQHSIKMFRYAKRPEDLSGRNGERKGKKREIRQKKSIHILEVDDKKPN